jgi:hypothetical protein
VQANRVYDGKRTYFVIVDSLDEYFAGKESSEISRALTTQCFSRIDVAFCRSQFFQREIRYSTFAQGRNWFSIETVDVKWIAKYASLLKKSLPDSASKKPIDEFLSWIRRNPSASSALNTPLRIGMAFEIILTNFIEGENIDLDLLALYENYISNIVQINAFRSALKSAQVFSILQKMAIATYSEGQVSHGVAPIGKDELVKVITSEIGQSRGASDDVIQSYCDHILNLDILSQMNSGASTIKESVDFTHKSFQECLVALEAEACFCGSSDGTVQILSSLLTAEVSEFLKECIKRISGNQRSSRSCVSILTGIIESASGGSLASAGKRGRLVLQQAYYYLGNIRSPESKSYLLDKLDKEDDPLLKRAMIVGLAFGGHLEPLDKYIEELRYERSSGNGTPLNDLNIGFHLSFFGDQPFDPESPEVDLGMSNCDKTVSRLSYQITTSTNQPNWRIDLYTLLDLRNRQCSIASYKASINENRKTLEAALKIFQGDRVAKSWPETKQFAELLEAYKRKVN